VDIDEISPERVGECKDYCERNSGKKLLILDGNEGCFTYLGLVPVAVSIFRPDGTGLCFSFIAKDMSSLTGLLPVQILV